MKANSKIAFVLFILILAFGVGINTYNKSRAVVSNKDLPLLTKDFSVVVGEKDAKVTVVEFMDPSCPTCKHFYPTVSQLPTKYDGKVKVVYRFIPIHNGSEFIFSLIEAANDQGRFDEALKQFFNQSNKWFSATGVNTYVAWDILNMSGVDVNRAKDFIQRNGDRLNQQFKQNGDDATALGATGTPTFYVNGIRLVKLSPEELTKLVDQEIKKNY